MIDRNDGIDREALAREARAWVSRMSSGEASPDDTAAMLRWRLTSPDHAAALGEAVRLRKRVMTAGEALRANPRTQWLFAPPARKASPLMSRRAVIGGALAASVSGVLLVRPPLGLWPSLRELRADYRTTVGERRPIQVAQGLTVELNTRTSIARRDDRAAYRLALIAGEVAVDAQRPARPVVIETERGEARTSDGRFGVRLLEAGTCVTCLGGTVDVAARGQGTSATLRSGQQVTLGETGFGRILSVDPQRADSWRRGELIFDNRPLKEVVAEINRYRPGRIILANAALADIPVNAVFRLDGIDRAVSQIREVSNASITNLPGGVVVLT